MVGVIERGERRNVYVKDKLSGVDGKHAEKRCREKPEKLVKPLNH